MHNHYTPQEGAHTTRAPPEPAKTQFLISTPSNVRLWWRWRSLPDHVWIQQTLCSDRPLRVRGSRHFYAALVKSLQADWKRGRHRGSAATLYCDRADGTADWPTNSRGKEQTVTFTLLHWSESKILIICSFYCMGRLCRLTFLNL